MARDKGKDNENEKDDNRDNNKDKCLVVDEDSGGSAWQETKTKMTIKTMTKAKTSEEEGGSAWQEAKTKTMTKAKTKAWWWMRILVALLGKSLSQF